MNRISVIMTTYNGSKYVYDQLDSICNQSLKADEVLVFDDRSTDDTIIVVDEIIKKYPDIPIRLSINQQNLGWQKNFINGISKSSGEYIFLADQDDIWKPNKIERMVKVMEEHDDILLLASNYEILNEREGVVNEYKYSRDFVNDSTLSKVRFSSKFYFVFRPGCTYCIRKELFEMAKKSWVELFPHDELLSVYGILTDSYYILNEALVLFRRHNNNASGMSKSMDKNGRITSCQTQLSFFENVLNDKDLNLTTEYRNEIISYTKYQSNRIDIFQAPSFIKWVLLFVKYFRFHFSVKSAIKDLLVAYRK